LNRLLGMFKRTDAMLVGGVNRAIL